MRSDVAGEDFERGSSAGADVVGAGPEVASPEVSADVAGELLAEPAGGDALERVDQVGEGDGGREADHQVDVVVFAVELFERAAEVVADVGHDLLAAGEKPVVERPSAVLGHEHQVDVTVVHRMSANPDVARVVCHTNMVRSLCGRGRAQTVGEEGSRQRAGP